MSILKKTLLGGAGILLIGIIALIAWLMSDIDKFDDSEFLPEAPLAVPESENAFYDLEKIHEEFLRAKTDEGIPLAELVSEEEKNRAQILELKFVQELPEALENAFQKKYFQGKAAKSFIEDNPLLSTYRNLIRLLAVSAKEEWQKGNEKGALKCFRIAEELTCRFGAQAKSMIEILVAVAMHGVTDRAILKILNSGDLNASTVQLPKVLRDRKYLAGQLQVGLQWEYKLLFELMPQQSGIASFLYSENMTKKFWIDVVKPAFDILSQEPLFFPQKEVKKADLKGRKLKPKSILEIRNMGGKMLLAIALPAIDSAVFQIMNSFVRQDLLKLRTALELHKFKHGRYPEELRGLDSEIMVDFPKDPWSNYRDDYLYNFAEGKLYSISQNYVDDGGRFTTKYSDEVRVLSRATPDLGMCFGEK